MRQASSRQKYAGRIESLAARVMKREHFNATEKMHLGLKTPVLVLATAEDLGGRYKLLKIGASLYPNGGAYDADATIMVEQGTGFWAQIYYMESRTVYGERP